MTPQIIRLDPTMEEIQRAAEIYSGGKVTDASFYAQVERVKKDYMAPGFLEEPDCPEEYTETPVYSVECSRVPTDLEAALRYVHGDLGVPFFYISLIASIGRQLTDHELSALRLREELFEADVEGIHISIDGIDNHM